MKTSTAVSEVSPPEDWAEKPLKELVTFDKGHVVATQSHAGEGFIPYIGAESLEGHFSQFTSDKVAVTCEPTDVLMLWDGERSGLCASGLRGAIGSTVARLRPRKGVDGRFLYYQIACHFAWIQARRTGTGVPHVPKDLSSLLRVSVPAEENEQAHIAAVLDTMDDAIAKLRQVRAGLLHDLLTRGLDQNGQLRDPIAHPEQFQDSPLGRIPREWNAGVLDDLVPRDRPIVYGILMPGRGFRDGVPVIKVKDIRGGRIDTADLLLTDPRIDEAYRRSRVGTGDLLFTIRGTVGRMAFVPLELNNANITQDTARVSMKDANPIFVARWLETPVPARFVDVHTIGVAVRGINLGEVRRIPVVLPPKEEQDTIATIISIAEQQVETEVGVLESLRNVKSGLMTDLLTGRVRVPETDRKPGVLIG